MIRTTIHLRVARLRLAQVDPSLLFGLIFLALFVLSMSVAGLVAPAERAQSPVKAPPSLLIITATPQAVEYVAVSARGRKLAAPTPAPLVEYRVVYREAPPAQVDPTPDGGNGVASTAGRP